MTPHNCYQGCPCKWTPHSPKRGRLITASEFLATHPQPTQHPDPRVYEALARWMQVRAMEGCPVMPSSFAVDALHSARGGLLRRLYDGKEPLQAPPPRSFSAPWYALMDAGAAGITGEMEVSMWVRPLAVDIVINQCAWHLVEQKGEHDFIIEYRGRDLSTPRWPAYRCTLVRQKTGAEFFNTWHLRPHAQEGAPET